MSHYRGCSTSSVLGRVTHKTGDPKINLSHTRRSRQAHGRVEQNVCCARGNERSGNKNLRHGPSKCIHFSVDVSGIPNFTVTHTAKGNGRGWNTSIKSILPVSDHTLLSLSSICSTSCEAFYFRLWHFPFTSLHSYLRGRLTCHCHENLSLSRSLDGKIIKGMMCGCVNGVI